MATTAVDEEARPLRISGGAHDEEQGVPASRHLSLSDLVDRLCEALEHFGDLEIAITLCGGARTAVGPLTGVGAIRARWTAAPDGAPRRPPTSGCSDRAPHAPPPSTPPTTARPTPRQEETTCTRSTPTICTPAPPSSTA